MPWLTLLMLPLSPCRPSPSSSSAPPPSPPSPAARAVQEAAEEQAVIKDELVAQLVRKGSAGLQELEALTHNARVPAEALARISPQRPPSQQS